MSGMYTDYEILLHGFLSGASSAEDFQRAYLERFKNESRELDEALFEILDELFGDVDVFCADPALLAELRVAKPGFYLDEKALHAKVAQASQRLARLQKQTRL
jgi:hypothetical protein